MDACPTGAIVAPGVIDARRCLAWLVQATGDFPVEHREALGDRIYGCDDCQDVCPVNRRSATSGVPAAEADARDRVDLVALLEADDDTLLAAYGRWYIPRRDPRYLRRNALGRPRQHGGPRRRPGRAPRSSGTRRATTSCWPSTPGWAPASGHVA